MGRFVFEDIELAVDDRTLAHLQVVVLSRLRRGEAFPFTWKEDAEQGRVTVWVHPTAKVAFHYVQATLEQVNLRWIELLTEASFSTAGLHLMPEPTNSGRAR